MRNMDILILHRCVQLYNCARSGASLIFNNVMALAAGDDHTDITQLCTIVQLCKDWGATSISYAAKLAVKHGHIEITQLCTIVQLCKDWRTSSSSHI